VSDWRPSSGPDAARTRAALLARIRACFAAANVLEVDTPALAPSAVSDPNIESFVVTGSAISHKPLFLHTSPEFCMKRLLAAGYPDIYAICRVFRDGEAGSRHQPEFTMVEWYRLGFSLDDIIDDALRLIRAALGSRAPLGPANVIDYRDAFRKSTGLDPLTAAIDDLADAAGADARLRRQVGDERDAWLDLLLATRVVPDFPALQFTVLRHYPASQAALARCCPADDTVADRFEVFLGDIELANGYVELTDAHEQRRRVDSDNTRRRKLDRATRPVDSALLAALESGLPPCAGVALGFERLQMLHDGTGNIGDVITFAYEPPV